MAPLVRKDRRGAQWLLDRHRNRVDQAKPAELRRWIEEVRGKDEALAAGVEALLRDQKRLPNNK